MNVSWVGVQRGEGGGGEGGEGGGGGGGGGGEEVVVAVAVGGDIFWLVDLIRLVWLLGLLGFWLWL